MTEEIKSCPFCGHRASWHKTKTTYCQLHGKPSQDYVLGCYACHCPAKPFVVGNIREHLIKRWNTRQS